MFAFKIVFHLSNDAKFGHRVYNAQKGRNGFCLLSDLGLVELESESIVVEILLHLLSIDIEDIQVHHGENTSPAFIAVSQLGVFNVKNTIEKREIIGDLLEAVDVKAGSGLLDCRIHVRHLES